MATAVAAMAAITTTVALIPITHMRRSDSSPSGLSEVVSDGVFGGVEITGPGSVTGGSVTRGFVASGSVTGGSVAGGSVMDGSVTGGPITGGSVAGGFVTGGSVAGGFVAGGSVGGV